MRLRKGQLLETRLSEQLETENKGVPGPSLN